MDGLLGNVVWYESPWTLGIGAPLLTLLLSELYQRMELRHHWFAPVVLQTRNLLLPLLAVWLFLEFTIGLAPDSPTVRAIRMALGLGVLYVALSFANRQLFAVADKSTWRGNVPKLLRDLIQLAMVALAGAVILSQVWGVDLGGLVAALGVGSLVVGLALQDTLGSVFAGIALLSERPFKIGDWIRVGTTEGKVVEINWRSVRVMDRNRDVLVIPNLILAKEQVLNFTSPSVWHCERVFLGFSYNDPPNRVKQVLLDIAHSTRGVLHDPAPEIRTSQYGDFQIVYEAKLCLEGFGPKDQIIDDFMTRIWYAARRSGLTIPFPTRNEIRIDPPEDDEPAAAARQLRDIPAFQVISDAIQHIDDGVEWKHFGVGEWVFKEGDHLAELSFIISGHGKLFTNDSEGQRHEVAELARGEFFGVGALDGTGKARGALVVVEDMQAIAIPSAMAHKLLDRHPAWATQFNQIVAARREAYGRVVRHRQRVLAEAGPTVTPEELSF